MIEIAICLAIIGFALVAIIGVLPLGMHTQRDTREETVINQDATVLLEVIRGAARGADNLTNNVYAITNYITQYNDQGNVVGLNPHVAGYTYTAASYDGTSTDLYRLTNGANIVGILSTPEFTDGVRPIPSLNFGGYSNHVVAYVRSISGLAAEKPPQNNQIMQEDTFTYRVYCVNAPLALHSPPVWLPAQAYNPGDMVTYVWNGQAAYWQANAATTGADVPGASAKWGRVLYPQVLADNLRELRLTFLWPQLPNGNVGAGRQTFRATIAGQLSRTNYYNSGQWLYFYQSQSFNNAP